ncbi:MAG TPA: TolC family protein [Pirellulales bacterium]|nr:TolC family protein [Pirellulales bacterium]
MPAVPPNDRRLLHPLRLATLVCAVVTTMAAGGDDDAPPAAVETLPAPLISPIETGRDRLDELLAIPADWRPWWEHAKNDTLLARPQRLEITADAVVLGALVHSAQVKVLRDVPAIQETAIAEACAQFDVRSFMESKFIDTSEPVGSTLTTGGPPRYLDQNWHYSGGVRKLGETGARLEASQRFGYEDSNSVFFVPEQQGTARLALSLTQPLLNGAGQFYNTSAIVLARIDTQAAQDKFSGELQTVLLEVQTAYWDLYRERVVLLQRRKLLAEGRRIYAELEGRREVDVVNSQLARAKAAVATRYAAVVRQEALVLNAEARLRALINDPELGVVSRTELVPVQPPIDAPQPVLLEDSLVVALRNRPEIDQAAREIRAASVRLDVSANELRPVLNFILASYVSGLEGDADIGGAWEDQFASGRPTYSAGLLFEYPLGNRYAHARLKKRRLELRQLTNQLEVTTANVRLEVETAVREITTTHREMHSHYHAIRGSEAEIDYLERRWRLLPGEQQVAGIVLDDLLNAQERLGRAEGSYAAALAAYNIALVQLKRAVGVLLQLQPMSAPHGAPQDSQVFAPPVNSIDDKRVAEPLRDSEYATRRDATTEHNATATNRRVHAPRAAWPPKTLPPANVAARPETRRVWPPSSENREPVRR